MSAARYAAVSVCALVVCLAATPAQATFPGGNGKIAFVSNRDGNREIYTMNADGTNQQNITNHPGADFNPAWSPDGSMILYTSTRNPPEPDGLFLMNANGSGVRRVTSGGIDHKDPAWGPDGWRIAYAATPGTSPQLRRSNLYGENLGTIYTGWAPAWDPTGESIVFERLPDGVGGLMIANWDGSGLHSLTTSGFDANPDWSPDGQSILFEHWHADSYQGSGLYTIDPDGGALARVPGSLERDNDPAWSPDGSRISFTGTPGPNGDIYSANPDGSDRVPLTTNPAIDESPAWQPLNPQPVTGYVRPKGATPINVALVPAFRQCETPNRTHGAPLAMPACSPPQQTSDFLTVGNPDTNGAAAQFRGSLRLDALVGNPGTSADEADLHIKADLQDLRCSAAMFACTGGAGSDYTGELEANFNLRITDRSNYPVPLDSATTTDVWRFPFTIPCSPTADSAIGGACSVDTTLDALMPGVVTEGVRSIWEFNSIDINDGGADGDNETDDFTLFARPGLFVP